ncbi:MAG TPA: DegQ family serine endoprotease [Bryobacteraceae bacterium]|nr:DegQ family serine endoprotease [Bryobacteraceae bacterium]
MKRNVVLSAAAAALAGSLITFKMTDSNPAPVYVHAQDQQYVSLTFAPLVKKALPAVVNVETVVRATPTRSQNRRAPQGLPPGFEEFFGFGAPRGPQEPRRGGGEGSGVIVTRDGYILTNNHVVEGATEVTVTLHDRRELSAKVIGADSRTDVAVLKVDATNLPVLPISDSAKVQVGDVALAMGNPFGIGQTVTMGIVSATGRGGLNPENYEDFIQTDAAINPGNSGGALVNTSGQLIGINTAIISRTGGNQGIGFAIPINMAREVMDQLVKTGKVVRGYMGAGVQEVTPELGRAFKLPQASGAAITSVEPDSPAEKGGLRAGDVVTAINGEPVADDRALRLRISRTAPGTAVKLSVQRAEGPTTVTVTLGRFPDRAGATPGEESGPGLREGEASALEGVSVTPLTPEITEELQLGRNVRGVVVTRVTPASAAAEAGLRRGDVIMQVNRRPVTTAREFEQAIGPGTVLLLVHRGGGSVFVAIEPKAANR